MDMTFALPEGPLRPWLVMAALLAFMLGLAHSVLGERYLMTVDRALDIARASGVAVVGLVTEQRPRPE